jgi:putative solute:sodium symporter small subunit
MSDQQQTISAEDAQAYWKANIRLISILLVIWAFVSYGCGILFAPFLNQFTVGSLPMGFWFAQQGSMYVFIILILVYAVLMDKTDQQFGVNE